VAQTDPTGSVASEHRGGHEGLEISPPGPHLVAAGAGYVTAAFAFKSRRAMDADAAMDAQTAPTAAWKSRQEREIPTSVHSPFLLLVFQEQIKSGRRSVQISAVSGDR
jgi:hypothetical protein